MLRVHRFRCWTSVQEVFLIPGEQAFIAIPLILRHLWIESADQILERVLVRLGNDVVGLGLAVTANQQSGQVINFSRFGMRGNGQLLRSLICLCRRGQNKYGYEIKHMGGACHSRSSVVGCLVGDLKGGAESRGVRFVGETQ